VHDDQHTSVAFHPHLERGIELAGAAHALAVTYGLGRVYGIGYRRVPNPSAEAGRALLRGTRKQLSLRCPKATRALAVAMFCTTTCAPRGHSGRSLGAAERHDPAVPRGRHAAAAPARWRLRPTRYAHARVLKARRRAARDNVQNTHALRLASDRSRRASAAPRPKQSGRSAAPRTRAWISQPLASHWNTAAAALDVSPTRQTTAPWTRRRSPARFRPPAPNTLPGDGEACVHSCTAARGALRPVLGSRAATLSRHSRLAGGCCRAATGLLDVPLFGAFRVKADPP